MTKPLDPRDAELYQSGLSPLNDRTTRLLEASRAMLKAHMFIDDDDEQDECYNESPSYRALAAAVAAFDPPEARRLLDEAEKHCENSGCGCVGSARYLGKQCDSYYCICRLHGATIPDALRRLAEALEETP